MTNIENILHTIIKNPSTIEEWETLHEFLNRLLSLTEIISGNTIGAALITVISDKVDAYEYYKGNNTPFKNFFGNKKPSIEFRKPEIYKNEK